MAICLFDGVWVAVYSDGRVCISILHPPGDDPSGYELASERWTPVHTVCYQWFLRSCLMILRLVLPILKLWRFRLRVLCWVLYLCFLVPTMSLLQTLKLLWVVFDWFNISLSDSLSLENLRSCVVVVFWSCVERVAWEETRVQEEGEPVCEKVSRNVMSNSELSTFLMISLYGVSSKLRHVPLSERHNLVYIFFFLLRSKSRSFWKVLLNSWENWLS